MNAMDLILQGRDREDHLDAFVISPSGHEVIQVSVPGELQDLHQAWLRRFLAHHDPAAAAVPAQVVHGYGARLIGALRRWLDQDEWAPLRQRLQQHPGLPLRIGCRNTPALIARLPWEALTLERPIWRLESGDSGAGRRPQRPWLRCPRVLLLAGQESGLNIHADIEVLQRLAAQRRIALQVLRGDQAGLPGLRRVLRQKQGWDVLVFAGHSAADPAGGRLQLADGRWISGQELTQELAHPEVVPPLLVLLNSCSGLDLARSCIGAGIPWAVCFREAVPNHAASEAFAGLLQALGQGLGLPEALQSVQVDLEQRGPAGCQLLLSGLGGSGSHTLQLPLRKRHQFRRRLASSQPRQLVAAAVLVLVAFAADLRPDHPVSTYLLDQRLLLQQHMRQRLGMPGPSRPPIKVLLLDHRAYNSLGSGGDSMQAGSRVSRTALAEVLRRTPPQKVPLVALDVVLDEIRDGEAGPTRELAEVIQEQRAQRTVVAGWFGPGTEARGSGTQSIPVPELQEAGLQVRDLATGLPDGDPGTLKPTPLRLLFELSDSMFAPEVAEGLNPRLPVDRLRVPPDAVLDWSLNWTQLIHMVAVDDLPDLNAAALLVGTDGETDGAVDGERPDLFQAPRAARGLWAAGGDDRIPGVLVQAALAQSIALGHWLWPLWVSGVTAIAAGVGVLVSAASVGIGRRLQWVGGIALVMVPTSLGLAITQAWLVPIVIPLSALAATSLMRKD